MSKYINRNTKLNSQVMDNVRMRKSVLYTLWRGGLICLLFLVPWNLQAQFFGTVGIDTNNDTAELNILDDDNLNQPNENEASRVRRTIKVVPVGGTSVTEGGTLKFKVAFTNSQTTAVQPITVTYQLINGTATGGGIDFDGDVGVDRTVVIPAHPAKESIEISISTVNDQIIEPDETFYVKLIKAETPAGSPIPSRENTSVATIFDVDPIQTEFTIIDNDNTTANKKLSIVTDTPEIDENGANNKAKITIKLPNDYSTSEALSINLDFATGSTATKNDDYTISSEVNGSNVITMPAGAKEVSFTITAVDDNILEPQELVKITGGTITGSLGGYGWDVNSTEVKINDKTDQKTDAKKLSVLVDGNSTIKEGQSATIRVKFTNNDIKSSVATDVWLALSGTANHPSKTDPDYNFTPTLTPVSEKIKVTIPANQNYVEFKLNALNDSFVELDETAIMTGDNIVSNIAAYTYSWTDASKVATVTIEDNTGTTDPDAKKLVISASPISIDEGANSTITVKFKDDNIKAGQAIEVKVKLTGDAIVNTDYDIDPAAALAGDIVTVTIQPNENKVTFTLKAKTDNIIEPDETVTLTGQAVAGLSWFTNPATVTIKDKTSTIANKTKVTIAPKTGSVDEGDDITIRVSLPSGITVANGVTIDVPLKIDESAANFAAFTADYTLSQAIHPNGIVQIVGPATSVDVVLSAVADGLPESDETVLIKENGAPASTVGFYEWDNTADQSLITIKDKSDASALELFVDIDEISVERGFGQVDVKLRTSAPANTLAQTVKVKLTQSGGTATTPADYAFAGGDIITLPAGQHSASIKINIPCRDAEEAKLILAAAFDDQGGIAGLTVDFGTNGNTITIKSIGVGQISGDATVCHDTPLTLSVNGPTSSTFAWKVDGGAIVGTSDSYVLPATTAVGVHTVTVDVTTPENCTITRTHSVTVKARPSAFTITSTSHEKILCGPSTATIAMQGAPASGDQLQWWRSGGSYPATGVEISGETGTTLIINETVAGTYKYWLVITNPSSSCGRKSGNEIEVSFSGAAGIKDPVLSSIPAAAGGTVDLSCSQAVILIAKDSDGNTYPSGTEYKWYDKNHASYPATIATNNEGKLEVTQAGEYEVVVVVGSCSSSTSNVIKVTGTPSGTIPTPVLKHNGAEPTGTIETCGSAELLTVDGAAGYTVVWMSTNESPISGVGNQDYYHAPAGDPNAIGYQVILTNANGTCISALSNTVYIKKKANAISITPPEIKTTPADGNGICGGGVTIEVTNGATVAADSYVWYKIVNGVTTEVIGQTGLILNLNTTADNGVYFVVAKKNNAACGGMATSAASDYSPQITINDASATLAVPKLKIEPAGAKLCTNGIVTIEVIKDTDNSPYNETGVEYIWYRGNVAGAPVAPAPYATTQVPSLNATVEGYYTVVVKRTAGGCIGEQRASSNEVHVESSGGTVNPADVPVIAQLTAGAGCDGGSVTLYVTNPNTTSAASYQWYCNGVKVEDSQDAGYGKGTTIDATVHNGKYTVILSLSGCYAESNELIVDLSGTTTSLAKPDLQPSTAGELEFCDGPGTNLLRLYVENISSYNSAVKFQWTHSVHGIVYNADGTQHTESYLFVPKVGPSGVNYAEGFYRVTASDGSCQSVPSDSREVKRSSTNTTDLQKPLLQSNSITNVACAGGSITISITNTDAYAGKTVTYEWYTTEDPTVKIGDNIASVFAEKTGHYYVKVIEGDCSVYSDPYYVEVNTTGDQAPDKPVIQGSNPTGEICKDNNTTTPPSKGTIELKAVKDGTLAEYTPAANYTFIWYKNGIDVSDVYGNTSVIITSDSARYHVAVTDVNNGCQSKPSAEYKVTVSTTNTAPVKAKINPDYYELPAGGSVRLTAEPINGGTFPTNATFKWYRVAGTNDYPYTPESLIELPGGGVTAEPQYLAREEGYYVVVVREGTCQSELSNKAHVKEVTVVAPTKPWIKSTNNNTEVCINGTLKLTAVPDDDRSGSYPNSYTYVWYVDKLDGLGYKEIAGEVYVSYDAPDIDAKYKVVAVNGTLQSAESEPFRVYRSTTNTAPVKPGLVALSDVICKNGSVTLMAKAGPMNLTQEYPATGTGYTFEWYRNGFLVATTFEINSYVYDWQNEDNDFTSGLVFSVVVKDSDCESASTYVTVMPGGSTDLMPRITAYGDQQEICQNGTAMLVVSQVVHNPNYVYRWFKVGDEQNYFDTQIPRHTVDAAGDYYLVILADNVPGACNSKKSNEVHFDASGGLLPDVPTIKALEGNTQLCANGVVRVSAATTATGVVGYRWTLIYANDTNGPGYETFETGADVNYIDITEYSKGNITVEVSYKLSESCVSKSALLQVTVVPGSQAAAVNLTAPVTDYCAGFIVPITATSGFAKYVWFLDGQQVAVSTISNVYEAKAAGKYTVYAFGDATGQTCESTASITLGQGDGSCAASYVELVVAKDVLNEGESTTVYARLKNNLKAESQLEIILNPDPGDSATRFDGPCITDGSSLGFDDYFLSSQILTIAVNQDRSNAIDLYTCHDKVYEGEEMLSLVAVVRNTVNICDTKTVKIIDMDAGADGKLNLKWELQQTTHSATGLTQTIYKGEHADFKVIAVAPNGVTPIRVQNEVPVAIVIYPTSTASYVIDYSNYTSATIPAGNSTTLVSVQTTDDKRAESDREFSTNIEAIHQDRHNTVHSTDQMLYIRSKDVNPTGGFDFEVTLTPARVKEGTGESFKLTISLISTDPETVLGDAVAFDLTQLATSIAKLGIDYSMPSVVTVDAGTRTKEVSVEVIDNELFDGDRRMDIDVTPNNPSKDRVMSKNPNPLSGVIEDDDKLCITITEKDGKKGIDDYDKIANIVVEAHNLSSLVGGVVIQLTNTNTTATQYYENVAEFTTTITLSEQNPTAEFRLISKLVSQGLLKEDFDITTYTSINDTVRIAIASIASTGIPVTVADLDCYEVLPLIISDDFDQDGIPNWVERKVDDPTHPNYCAEDTGDSNDNGILNEWDPYDPNADDDGDGIPNWMEDTNHDGNPYNDFAGTSCLPNFANPDSDGDGVPDAVEDWSNRPYDNNGEDIRIHPALSLNNDGIGNDRLYIENIHKYQNKVTVFDRQGVVIWEESDYRNDSDKAFVGISKKTKKKVPMGTYFVIVEYVKDGSKKYYDKAVEVRY